MKPKRSFVWTPDLAYIVGLITTDGCLYNDGRHISFTSRDIDLIETFASLLCLTNKIGKTTNLRSETHRIQFCDIQLYHWLLSIGLTPCKSKTINSIKIPDIYFKDFLRGHLDGDGSITRYTDTYNTYKDKKYVYERLCVRFISASNQHMIWLDGKIRSVLGIQGSLHTTKKHPKTGTIIHVLKFGKKDSLKLLTKIYYSPEIPSLKRKKMIALDCLSSPLLLPKKNKSPIVRV